MDGALHREQHHRLSNVKIADIFAEALDHPLTFAEKSIDIFEVVEISEKVHKEKTDLEAVIITENGKRNEKPLGFITAWDLIEIDYTVD